MAYYPDRRRYDFFSPPEWRWLRARDLVEQGLHYAPHRDDVETGRAARYLRALASPGRRAGMTLASMRDIGEALLLHESGGSQRLLVEARQLAGQGSQEIAALTNTPVAVVLAYESLFFDCRGRFEARDWVAAQAVGMAASRRDACDLRAITFKSFAFNGGPLVLEAVLPYLLGGKELFETMDASTPEGRTDLETQLAVALELIPQDPDGDVKLFKIMPILLGRRPAASRRPKAALLAEKVEEWLDELASGALDEPVRAAVSSAVASLLGESRRAA